MTDPRQPEDRLRSALQSHADQIEPSPDGLDRIEEKLMATRSLTSRQALTLKVAGAAAAVLILVLGAVALFGGDDEDAGVATASTTTTEDTTPTTESTTTTETPFTPAVDPFSVAFPSPDDSRRFDSPEAAARSYAADVLGFTELEVGEYREGDSRSGEVPVTDRPGRAETTILVRQMEDDHWYVLASVTGNIEVDEPTAGDEVRPLFRTSGRALAFEGTVDVLVLRQGDPAPLGEGFVTGSGVPPAGPFNGRIEFEPPAQDTPGVLVFRTLSAEDGRVQEATSFPVRLSPGSCESAAPDGDGSTLVVWMLCEPDGFELSAVERPFDGDPDDAYRAAMIALLDGPTADEADAGFSTVFAIGEAALLDLAVDNGIATVDLDGAVGDELANSSFNILALRDQVFFTLSQFDDVYAVDVLFDGSCDAFAAWAQSDSCRITG